MLCCLFLLLLWSSLSGARRPNQELIEGVIFRVPGINVDLKLFSISFYFVFHVNTPSTIACRYPQSSFPEKKAVTALSPMQALWRRRWAGWWPDTNSSNFSFQFYSSDERIALLLWMGLSCSLLKKLMGTFRFEFVELEESVASKVGFLFADAIRMLVDKVIKSCQLLFLRSRHDSLHPNGQEIDMITMPMPMKWDQLSKVDYSYPNQFEEYTLMQKYPEEESRLSAILKPFSMTVSFERCFEINTCHWNFLIYSVLGVDMHDCNNRDFHHYFDNFYEFSSEVDWTWTQIDHLGAF